MIWRWSGLGKQCGRLPQTWMALLPLRGLCHSPACKLLVMLPLWEARHSRARKVLVVFLHIWDCQHSRACATAHPSQLRMPSRSGSHSIAVGVSPVRHLAALPLMVHQNVWRHSRARKQLLIGLSVAPISDSSMRENRGTEKMRAKSRSVTWTPWSPALEPDFPWEKGGVHWPNCGQDQCSIWTFDFDLLRRFASAQKDVMCPWSFKARNEGQFPMFGEVYFAKKRSIS